MQEKVVAIATISGALLASGCFAMVSGMSGHNFWKAMFGVALFVFGVVLSGVRE